jgi:hypothetical protein
MEMIEDRRQYYWAILAAMFSLCIIKLTDSLIIGSIIALAIIWIIMPRVEREIWQ